VKGRFGADLGALLKGRLTLSVLRSRAKRAFPVIPFRVQLPKHYKRPSAKPPHSHDRSLSMLVGPHLVAKRERLT
jgi:hypothetical protein